MRRTPPPPPAPLTDEQLVVRVHLGVCDGEVNVTVIVQRTRARRRLVAIADRLPEMVASAIVGVLVAHLAALL